MNSYNPTNQHRFQLTQAWAVVGLFIGATLAVSVPVGILELIAKALSIKSSELDAWFMVLATIISYAFLFFIINQIFGRATIAKPLFADRHIDWTVYILILLATSSLAIILEPLSTLLLKFWPMPEWFENYFGQVFTVSISTFILAVIVAPLCEEVLLRGVILRGLLTSMSPKKAIIWSAFFFALIHFNPWQALPAFVIGLFLGWMYWKTKSIWPCIFIHFVNNLFAFIGITIADSKGLDSNTTLQDLTGGYFTSFFVVATVLLIVSFGLLQKRYKLKKGNIP